MPRLKGSDKKLMSACAAGDLEAAKSALEAGADPNCHGSYRQTPLVCAIMADHFGVADVLLSWPSTRIDETGVDDITPLVAAAQARRQDLVERLVEMGADLTIDSKRGWNVVEAALLVGTEHAERLLTKGASIDLPGRNGQTLLFGAAKSNPELARWCLAHGANPNARSKEQQTPLHWAARHGCHETAALLLDASAAADAADEKGQTPLFEAIIAPHTLVDETWRQCGLVAELLIDRGANIEHMSSVFPSGRTPLMEASWRDQEDAARLLLAAEARLETTNSEGETAFFLTAICGALSCAKLLGEAGANVSRLNHRGQTALDLALQQRADVGKGPEEFGVTDPRALYLASSPTPEEAAAGAARFDRYIEWLTEVGVPRK